MSQPAHKIRIGALQVTIWRNHGDKGNWYSVIPSRSYKQEDAWNLIPNHDSYKDFKYLYASQNPDLIPYIFSEDTWIGKLPGRTHSH